MAFRSATDATYASQTNQRIEGLRFDWCMLACSLWLVAGASIDAWAHTHYNKLETFFTPWHAVLYSGFLSVTVCLGAAFYLNHVRGHGQWIQAIPRGYELSAAGALLFSVGGIGDMLWHIYFGIEKGIDALLSPTHLALSAGSLMIVTGPLRAAWQRSNETSPPTWRNLGPVIVSLGFLFALMSYMSTFSHPFVRLWPLANATTNQLSVKLEMIVGVSGILLQASLLIGVVLFSLRRWRLPIGGYTTIFLINSLVISAFSKEFVIGIPVALLTGLVADILNQRLQPSETNVSVLRLFAFIVPALFFLLYFVGVAIVGLVQHRPFIWSIHMWMGTVVLAGVVGLLLSFIFVAPKQPSCTAR